MPLRPVFFGRPPRQRRRLIHHLVLAVGLSLGVLIVVSAVAIMLILRHGAQPAAAGVHAWMATAYPFTLGGQVLGLAALWYFWPALIRRTQLPDPVAAAWRDARHRLALCGLVLLVLGAFLWFPR